MRSFPLPGGPLADAQKALHAAVLFGQAVLCDAGDEAFSERTLAAHFPADVSISDSAITSPDVAVRALMPGSQPLAVGTLPDCAYDLVGTMALHAAAGCAAAVILLGDVSGKWSGEVMLLLSDDKHKRHALCDMASGQFHVLGDLDNAMPAFLSGTVRKGARPRCWAYEVLPTKEEPPAKMEENEPEKKKKKKSKPEEDAEAPADPEPVVKKKKRAPRKVEVEDVVE